MKKIGLSVVLLGCCINAFALFQCPGGEQFVSVGDSLKTVLSKCGKPKSLTTQKQTPAQDQVWSYRVFGLGSQITTPGFTVHFKGNKVVSVQHGATYGRSSVPGNQNTIPCPRGSVTIGNTMKEVETACGMPVTKQPSDENIQSNVKKVSITTVVYQPQSYLPETTFVFHDGTLKSIGGG